ncbi:MAG TPA: DNA polymerase III subunit gamma/tau [Patescibacteria group bacterium]|nr:DNA polymerase III subunit gamma/tau [Patescibacteria group bacterium]
MSYQVIARKYRPQTFEEVVGQRPIVTTLKNAVEQRRVHHAYLFSGPRGVGKTTVARLLAKSLNCATGPTPVPCNACASCAEIAQSRSMDVLEIDGASNRGIENIRELRETVRYAPARDRYKVFIIDEVHMLTDPAWNALLKTLEEPPPQVVFIFATTEYREIPRTILSRCQHFEFRKVAPSELLAHLAKVAQGESVTVEPQVFDLIARVADGSLRDALSALDQVIAFSGSTVTADQARTILGVVDRELILGFYQAVRERDCARLIGIVDTLFEKGYQPVEFLEDLMAHGRDLLLLRALPETGHLVAGTEDELRAMRDRARSFSEDELLRILELLTREAPRLRGSSHARFLLEALAIKLARLTDLRPIEELLARLDAPGRPADAGAPPAAPPAGAKTGPAAGGFGVSGGAATTARGVTAAPVVAPAATTVSAAAPASASPATPAFMPEPGSALPTPLAGTDAPVPSEALVEALLRRVHDERAAVGAMLEQAAWIQVEEDLLRVVFAEKHGFFRDKVQSREVSDYIRRVGREMAGRELRVQVECGAPGVAGPAAPALLTPRPAATGPAPSLRTPARVPAAAGSVPVAAALNGDPGRRALVERALQEPSLRSVLDLFDGEIVEIEPV